MTHTNHFTQNDAARLIMVMFIKRMHFSPPPHLYLEKASIAQPVFQLVQYKTFTGTSEAIHYICNVTKMDCFLDVVRF